MALRCGVAPGELLKFFEFEIRSVASLLIRSDEPSLVYSVSVRPEPSLCPANKRGRIEELTNSKIVGGLITTISTLTPWC